MYKIKLEQISPWAVGSVKESFNRLPKTEHRDGQYRLRRYSKIKLSDTDRFKYMKMESGAFNQSAHYNHFQGGVDRSFQDIEDDIIESGGMLEMCDKFLESSGCVDDHEVEIHQMRIITRDELFPILKLSVNYASYLTFNTILNDVKSKVKDYKKVSKALVAFSAKLKSEAMFGNTLLPLYIVYGMGGGAHYKGTRDEFENMTTATLAERGKEMDVPYVVLQISKPQGKKHNAIWALVLAGVQGNDKSIKPEYVKIQFINRSGSTFSYKIDASTTTTKWN